MLTCRSFATRFALGAGLASAMLGSVAVRVPAVGADPANPALASITAGLPAAGPISVTSVLSAITVKPGGTEAWVEFTSSEPASAAVSVKPTLAIAAPPSPAPVSGPRGGLAGIVAPVTGGAIGENAPTPTFETTHRLQLTNLQSNTAYDATVSGETHGGTKLAAQVHFKTLKQRVAVILDTIDVTEGSAWIGDNSVNWTLGLSWGPDRYPQQPSVSGSAGTCFPSNDVSVPGVAGVCQDGSYGDGKFSPLNNHGKRLAWLFAEENFDFMPRTFSLEASATLSDLLNGPWTWPFSFDPIEGCHKATVKVPQNVESGTIMLSTCGDGDDGVFDSTVNFLVVFFYDNSSYPAPQRNHPTDPWANRGAV